MPKRSAVIKKIGKAANARDMTFDFKRRGVTSTTSTD
jgi:hypothetical protein